MNSEPLVSTGVLNGLGDAAVANRPDIVGEGMTTPVGHSDMVDPATSLAPEMDALAATYYSPSSISSSPPLAPSEDGDDEFEGFSLDNEDDTWSTTENFTFASSINSTTPLIPSPEVRNSYHFRGGQYETVRTVIRPNPEYRPVDADETPQSPQSRPGTPQSGSDTSACTTPIEESLRLLEELLLTSHFEEEVEYRQSSYVLEQAQCGRVEIWITRERETFSESEITQAAPKVEQPTPFFVLGNRPRVFFKPTTGPAN